jgi:hypothetical protein
MYRVFSVKPRALAKAVWSREVDHIPGELATDSALDARHVGKPNLSNELHRDAND